MPKAAALPRVRAADALYEAANALYESAFLDLGAPRLRDVMNALSAYELAARAGDREVGE